MTPFAIFGIENDSLNLAVNLVLLFLIVLWIALLYWTFADARRRIEDPMLIGCATAVWPAVLFGTTRSMVRYSNVANCATARILHAWPEVADSAKRPHAHKPAPLVLIFPDLSIYFSKAKTARPTR